ncbi:MAG: GNAT family N-acetyltransferase, partial [Desulfobacteraceae bacterium]
MPIKIITTTQELEGLKPEWDETLARSDHQAVNLSYDWTLAWWHNFGNTYQPYVILVYDADRRLKGIAPLFRSLASYRGFKIDKLALMANGHSPFAEIVADRESVEAVIEAVLEHLETLSDWDLIHFTKMYEAGSTCRALQNRLKREQKPFGIKDNIESPYIRIDSDWETFLARRSSKFRKSLRNKLNRAGQSGDLVFEKIHIADGNSPALQDMFAVSRQSWKAHSGTDISSSFASSGFYKELCDRFGPQRMAA